MKIWKLLILVCGAVGLGIAISDFDAFKGLLTHPFDHGGAGVILILGWAVPALMGLLGFMAPPFKKWQAVASLAGFGALIIKTRAWEHFKTIGEAPMSAKAALAAVAIGALCSVLALVKPERE